MLSENIDNPYRTPLIIVSTNQPFTNAANFHVRMDNQMIHCKDAVDAVSKLVKVFYVFNISYDPNLRNVLEFLAHYLFKITTGDTTSQMKVLNTYLQTQ